MSRQNLWKGGARSAVKSSRMLDPTNLAIEVPAPRYRWVLRAGLPLGILLVFGGVAALSLRASLTPAVEVETAPVVERPAIKGSADLSASAAAAGEVIVQAAGWIEPDPFPVYASALTNGTVEEVLFLEGERVERGEALARLVDEDARLALDRARAEARAAQESWEANIEATRAAAVASALVAEIEASLELARAELAAEEARLTEADRVYKRRKNLVDDGTVAEEDFDIAEAAAAAQQASVLAARSRIAELQAKLSRTKAEEAAAQRRLQLRTEERRRLEMARVALAEAELRVERLQIRAPIDGAVMRRLIEPGSAVMAVGENRAMSQVAALYDPEKLQVRVDVPLADAAKVGVGQPADVIVEVLPDQTFRGTVTRVTNFADIQKNTLEVKVALDNPAEVLKPEMLARVRFLAIEQPETLQGAIQGTSVFAPAEAVSDGAAWVVTQFDGEEGVAVRRPVELTGAQEAGWQEVATGLLPGDLLVLSSAKTLKPNTRVRVRAEGK